MFSVVNNEGTRYTPFSDPCGLMAPGPEQSVYSVVSAEHSCSNSSDYSFSTSHVQAFTHQDFNSWRQLQICPRSKLYHAEAFSAFYSFALPLPTDNSPRQDAGNLCAFDGQCVAVDY